MKRLSVVIVTYNNEDHIFDCVNSIQQHSDLPLEEIELVIVDNHSYNVDAMFAKLCQLWGADIVLVKNNINGGYGQGNNLGISHSTAPIVLIMNPDVRLYEPIFKKAILRFEGNKQVGVLGMVQMSSETKRSNHSFCPTWLINGYLQIVLYAICNRTNYYMPFCTYVQGSCFFIRKEMFLTVGGFDETNFMYGEEEDLYYRLRQLYGTVCFAFERTLHYIHLATDRLPSLEYEKKLYEVNVALYKKKGIDERIILRHFLQSNRLLLWKESIKCKNSARHKVLKEFRHYLLRQREPKE